MSSANVRDNYVEHLAIGHLLNQYTDCLNRGDWDTMGLLFTEAATWRVITNGEVEYEFRGGMGIAAGLQAAVSGGTRVMAQMNHAPVIHVDGDDATASSMIEELYWGKDGTRVHKYAMYADEIVLEGDGEWRFALREFRSKGKLTIGDQIQT